MTQPASATTRALTAEPEAAIKHHLRGQQRISLTRLARLCGVTTRQLEAALKARTLAHWMKKRGWHLTNSKSLGLPALQFFPHTLPYLVRDAPQYK